MSLFINCKLFYSKQAQDQSLVADEVILSFTAAILIDYFCLPSYRG